MLPVAPAAAIILALRMVIDERSLALALAELGLFLTITAALTLFLERRLLAETLGYVGGGRS